MSAGLIQALIYLQYHSLKNRLVLRFKRLRQPKYLVGGIVGGLYFYFYFFRYVFGFNGNRPGLALPAGTQNAVLYEMVGALVLLVLALLAWCLPRERAALVFSEAEVAFLFPAPISRRGLIHFKLLRSQTAILFTTLILTLVTRRFGGHAWIRAGGWWLILSALNLHSLGSSFARTLLLDRGITNWQRRSAIVVLVGALAVFTVLWTRRTLPPLDFNPLEHLDQFKTWLDQALNAGPTPYLLYPFRLLVRPFQAADVAAFLRALAPALLVNLLLYWWVVRADVAFEEASVEASKEMADKVASIRAGNWRGARKTMKSKRPPFVLRPLGPRPVALLWKNLLSAGQGFTVRTWLFLVVVGVTAGAALRGADRQANWVPVLGMVAGIVMLWTLLLGPQFARQDFRQDLLLADLLKTYPLPGWQIALGELLAPAAILTGIQTVLLIFATGALSLASPAGVRWPVWLGIGFGLLLILPLLTLITLQIPNAAVLLFPAWLQAGKAGTQAAGIEVTGQRLIFMLGTLVAFIVSLLPAAAIFAGVFFLTKLWLNLALAISLAAVSAAVVLAVEAGLGVLLLGWLFERLDLTSELNG